MPEVEEWERLLQELFTTTFERLSAKIRHELKGTAAVARLYLGASSAHCITAEVCELGLAELVDRSCVGSLALATDVDDFVRFLKAEKRPTLNIAPPSSRLVLIDDQAEDAGWTLFLRDLQQSKAFESSQTFTKFEQSVETLKEKRHDVLLLDCALHPDDPSLPSGLAQLATIRSFDAVGRIILMTAFDDADLAVMALREGADHFFVKQLVDRSDRSSVDYFRRFAELTAAGRNTRLDHVWKISQSWARRNVSVDKRREWAFLRLCAYFACSYECGTHWWRSGGFASLAPLHEIRSLLGILLSAAFPGGVFPFKGSQREKDEATGLLYGCRHGNWPEYEAVVHWLYKVASAEYDASYSKTLLPSPSRVQLDGPYTNDQLNGSLEVELALARQQSHTRRQVSSAKLLCSTSDLPQLEGSVLFVDDEALETGWNTVLARMLPGLHHCCSLEELRQLSLRQFDAVLLDVRLPNVAAGLTALDAIKELDPALPVVLTSSSPDAVPILRAMRRGGVGYVPRTFNDEDGARLFALRLHETLVQAFCVGRTEERVIWREWASGLTPGSVHPEMSNRWRIVLKSQDVTTISIPDPEKWFDLAIAFGNTACMLAFALRFRQLASAENWSHVQPPDFWRMKAFGIEPDLVLDEAAKWLVVGAVESIAKWRYSLRARRLPKAEEWGLRGGIEVGTQLADIAGAHDLFTGLRPNRQRVMSLHEQMTVLRNAIGTFSHFVSRPPTANSGR